MLTLAADMPNPSMLARIERAIYRLQNTHGLPLQPLGDGSDPPVVLRDCADDHVHMRRVLCELREATSNKSGRIRPIGCVTRSRTR